MRLKAGAWASFYLILVIGLTVIGHFGVGPIPPLMRRFFPFQGIWRAESQKLKTITIRDAALRNEVRVVFDTEGIPHILAQSNEDLYWAQGYITARDRLWQMDFQSRVADGSLSELVGEKAKVIDEHFVKLGMRQAIAAAERELNNDEVTRQASQAYVEGVNAYVNSLSEDELPIEYFLTRTRPRLWTSRQISALLKLMAFRLSGYSDDLVLTRYLQKYGHESVEDLFPEHLSLEIPFAKVRTKEVLKSFGPKEKVFVTSLKNLPESFQPVPGNGSNNWAVNGFKTKSGYTLLANDTHLSYSLPSIWYEMQLSSPGISVYGVTIPGAPGIIIGYNEKIAWATTNASTDVMDWYEIEFRDETSEDYLVDGQWVQPVITSEYITIKGGEGERSKIDILWTHLGPVVHREGRIGLALRWVAHEASNELKALLNLNRSQNFQQCMRSLVDFMSPAQNFICADANNISIRHNGRLPKRKDGQGKFVLNGRSSTENWQGWLSSNETPQEINPKSGFVHSANQRPVSGSESSYLGWSYPEAFRGKRIVDFLSLRENLDVSDMAQLQNDVLNSHAKMALPFMLALTGEGNVQEELGAELYSKLKDWDFLDRFESVQSSLFSFWWKHFETLLWDDDFGFSKAKLYPSRDRTLKVLENLLAHDQHPDLRWVDNLLTSEKEGPSRLLQIALEKAVEEMRSQFGRDIRNWEWGRVRPTKIDHLSRIPGLGATENISMGGSQYAVNSNKGYHGPTWRMVVSFEPKPQGFGAFPGGITGNPFDPDYQRFLRDWSKGELRSFKFFHNKEDFAGDSRQILIFLPKRGAS